MIGKQSILLMDDELIVEEFAAIGGMTEAIEMACGRPPNYSVNHDDDACSGHLRNHPQTIVFCADVFGHEVAPRVITEGRPVGLYHMSPDCTHFSQAKGGQPRDRKVRALAWIGVRWMGQVRPRIVTMENVKQMLKWGPLIAKRDQATGRVVKLDGSVAAVGERVPVQQQYLIPDPKREGQTWRRFVQIFREAGYDERHFILKAANYGAGTLRERLFWTARCDGAPIVEPVQTHFEKPAKGQKPWVQAHECIDFSIEGRSIFGRKRPLADATMRRVAFGMKKYVLDCADPFIVPVTHQGEASRVHSLREPFRTITGAHRGELMLAAPMLVGVTQSSAQRVWSSREPIRSITTAKGGEFMLAAAFVEQANGGRNTMLARSAREPVSTIMTHGANQRLVTAHLAQLNNNCNARDLREPLRAIRSGGENHALVEYTLSPEAEEGALRCAAFLIRYYGSGGQWGDLRDPMATVTTHDRLALVTVWLQGEPYVVVDICLRMLTPRELANATSFPAKYILDHGHDGRVFSKTKQVEFIGNAVPPLMGAAFISAQWNSRPPLRAAA